MATALCAAMASSLGASHSLALPLGTINLPRMNTCMQARNKQVWIWTSNKEVMTASVEGGWNTFIFTPDSRDLINNWSSIARIDPLILDNGRFLTSENKQRGVFCEVHSPHELSDLRATVGQEEIVVMGATDWRVIPAEQKVQLLIFLVVNHASLQHLGQQRRLKYSWRHVSDLA